MTLPDVSTDDKCQRLAAELDAALAGMAAARDFAKPGKLQRILDFARRLMLTDGGFAAIEARSDALERAQVFAGSDWAQPHILVPALSGYSLKSPDANTVVIEALSELRLLAAARGNLILPQFSAEQAHHYLTQVLAINLAMLFTPLSEAERATQGRLAGIPRGLLKHLAGEIGYEHIIDKLIDEIWRVLRQRPVQVESVKQMITQIAICQGTGELKNNEGGIGGEPLVQGADRLVSSLFGPTQLCREDPGVEVYRERLSNLDSNAVQAEATGFARAMHDTGLVSPYHAVLLRHICATSPHLVVDALGLSGTGRDSLLCYHELVMALVDKAVTPYTPQAVFGLTLILERGILYHPAAAPSLWRQLNLKLSHWSEQRLLATFGYAVAAQTRLLEGVLLVLGLPLGIGQGNNPTCQSARAISIWSYGDPDYLLQIVASAARDDEIVMHFEGQAISSKTVTTQLAGLPMDLDPVSIILVPHLDYIYGEMGTLCLGREGDPHRWINPEFHGWRVGRGFRINVEVASGQLTGLESFFRDFYAYYHPYYNGNQPLIHPQPAGLAITDSAARFIGWHAITIQRVALDPSGRMRVYFYNPNNDSGQDWGDGIVVSTADNGELFGESSLGFEEFASRIYIFHYDALERGDAAGVPEENIGTIIDYIHRSWGKDRTPAIALQASQGAPSV
tara:strand:- start:46006 stop:48045 length:2040 start_codon:yes stop_codon:yes gene_type:complete